MSTQELLERAKAAKYQIAAASSETKNLLLEYMAQAIEVSMPEILEANRLDVEAAAQELGSVMIDRLKLSEARIRAMAEGIREVIALEDPCGRCLSERTRPNGLNIQKISVPMGVIAIIYESRPNVTSDAAALCIKSGNACVLRAGRQAHRSCSAVVAAMKKGIASAGGDPEIIQFVEDTSHASANELMKAKGYIDLLIPRGGKRLIDTCVENAIVPVIETGTGICSVFVDESADLQMALNIVENAKTSRPSVCNAEETLLVHEKAAKEFLPMLRQRIPQVELRLDSSALQVMDGKAATDEDFDTEFLDYILAVKVVRDVDEAIAHIQKHSTHHTESIITRDMNNARRFRTYIDSAVICVNASTRFTDGGEFGLGCEMGISTQKLHARGPMGLEELCSYQYFVQGDGQIR